MKRRSLCGKRVLAVILAAALCMNSTVTVLAEPDSQTENNLDSPKIEVKSGETAHEEKIEKDSASSTDGTSAVDVSMDNGDEVTVEIKGDVTVSGGSEEQASEPNYEAAVSAVAGYADNPDNQSSEAIVSVGGNVSFDTDRDDIYPVGIDATAFDDDCSTVLAGNVEVESTSQSQNNAVGISSTAVGGNSYVGVRDVNVKAGGTIDGISANSSGGHAEAAAENVKASSSSRDAVGVYAAGSAYGITVVSVEGDIYTEGNTHAIGVQSVAGSGAYYDTSNQYVPASDGGSSVEVSGGVTARAGDGDGIASGISVINHGGFSSVGVRGPVTAEGKNTYPAVYGNAEYDAVGIDILYASDNTENDIGSETIVNSGTIDAHSDNRSAYGINLSNNISNGAQVEIYVDGDVKAASGGDYTAGIYGRTGTGGSASINVSGDVTGTASGGNYSGGVVIDNSMGNLEVEINGSVRQISKDGGQGILISQENADATKDATISIHVGKDVISGDKAVLITKASESNKMELQVQGTVSGENHNFVLEGAGSTENLDITVWKVDTSDEKAVVENRVNTSYVRNEEAEKKINYIIKVDESSDYKINLNGTTKNDNGLEVAHEGDRVYLNVNIPDGYTAEFYDINKNRSYDIVPNGYGGAYLVVPRGGGVQVGVTLTKIKAETEASGNTENHQPASTYTPSESDDDSSYDSSAQVSAEPKTSDNGNNGSDISNDAATAAIMSMQIHVTDLAGGDKVLNVGDVLRIVDTLTAINNFTAANAGIRGTENVMGAGIVSFGNMFADSINATVEVPVAANVSAGQTYTVVFSDGTSIEVPCTMAGVLSIPFNKNAEGLTYMIYGPQMNPAMFIGMQPGAGF